MLNKCIDRNEIRDKDFCYYIPKKELAEHRFFKSYPAIFYFHGYIYDSVSFLDDYIYCVIRNGLFYYVEGS